MDALSADITLPLRSFELRVGLPVGAETVALVGPSGAGKSTVLRAIAGLVRPLAGRIALGGDVWFDAAARIDLPPEQRRVGLVFQEYALFPHLSVRENVLFGAPGAGRAKDRLPGRAAARAAARARADAILERFHMAHLAGTRPGTLSGGERQRVALARAIAREPGVLLLDEPLSALDAHTKATVRTELHGLLRDLGLPALIVTHDFEDAAALATRIGVLVDGTLRQLATPAELVAAPADAFVARLTGANLLHGIARSTVGGLTRVDLDGGGVLHSASHGDGPVGAVIYPWDITISRTPPDDSAVNHLAGPIVSLVTVDNRVRVRVGPITAEVTQDSALRLGLGEGEHVVATFKATATRLVDLAR